MQDAPSTSLTLMGIWLLLSAAHGFYLTTIALTSARTALPNIFLSLLLFAISYSLLCAFLLESKFIFQVPYLMGTQMPLEFLIGPAFYFYVKSTVEDRRELNTRNLVHLAPAFLAILFALPYYMKTSFEKANFTITATSIPIERMWYMASQILVTSAYLYFSHRMLRFASPKKVEWQWLKNIHYALWSLTAIYIIVVPAFFSSAYFSSARMLYWICMCAFVHLVGILILRESHIIKQIGKTRKVALLDEQQLRDLKEKIIHYMSCKPWMKNDFNLRELSDAVGSNSLYTSTVLNQIFGQNFNDFVNGYRVACAKQLLETENLKLYAVALESGFANKNSFNRVFKKITGLTPTAYKEKRVTI